MATQWTGENVLSQIENIYSLPLEKRIEIATEIRRDLKGWVECNYIFTTRQQKCINLMPPEFFDEIGYQIARAIEKLYPLDVFVSDDTIPPAQSKKGGGGEVGWSEKEGFKASIKFTF